MTEEVVVLYLTCKCREKGSHVEDNQGQGVIPFWKWKELSWCGCKEKRVEGSAPTERKSAERGKRDVYCDKQIGKAVTALNCVLKGLWGEVGSGGIRKKLKSEYVAYLESKYRRNDGSSI